jgi:hypothetical protein
MASHRHAAISLGFDPDPIQWADDGGMKRVPIYDRCQARLVRKVGWVNCLGQFSTDKPHRFFSTDVVKVRICDPCKHNAAIVRSRLGCED